MRIEILIILITACVLSSCEDLFLGDPVGRSLVHHTVAQYQAFPQRRRLKYIVYNSSDFKKINAISAEDHLKSSATANVLAGGIGYTYVTLKLLSERGKGLDYEIKIFS